MANKNMVDGELLIMTSSMNTDLVPELCGDNSEEAVQRLWNLYGEEMIKKMNQALRHVPWNNRETDKTAFNAFMSFAEHVKAGELEEMPSDRAHLLALLFTAVQRHAQRKRRSFKNPEPGFLVDIEHIPAKENQDENIRLCEQLVDSLKEEIFKTNQAIPKGLDLVRAKESHEKHDDKVKICQGIIDRLMESLTERSFLAMIYSAFGMSPKEIAGHFKRSSRAINRDLHDAETALRSEIGRALDD